MSQYVIRVYLHNSTHVQQFNADGLDNLWKGVAKAKAIRFVRKVEVLVRLEEIVIDVTGAGQ